MNELSHIDDSGTPRMVDVSAKAATLRKAVAEGFVIMQPQTLARVKAGDGPKGDVLGVARIAGVMAAKKTGELIPLCHPLGLSRPPSIFKSSSRIASASPLPPPSPPKPVSRWKPSPPSPSPH